MLLLDSPTLKISTELKIGISYNVENNLRIVEIRYFLSDVSNYGVGILPSYKRLKFLLSIFFLKNSLHTLMTQRWARLLSHVVAHYVIFICHEMIR